MLFFRCFCVVLFSTFFVAQGQDNYTSHIKFEGPALDLSSFEWVINHSSPFFDSTGMLLSVQEGDHNELTFAHDYPFVTLWVRLRADEDWYNRELCLLDSVIVLQFLVEGDNICEIKSGMETKLVNVADDSYSEVNLRSVWHGYQAVVEGMHPGMIRDIPFWELPSFTRSYLNKFERRQVEVDSLISLALHFEVKSTLQWYKAIFNHYLMVPSLENAEKYVDSIGEFGKVRFNRPLFTVLTGKYSVFDQPESLLQQFRESIQVAERIRNPNLLISNYRTMNIALKYHRQWRQEFGTEIQAELYNKIIDIRRRTGISCEVLDTTPRLGGTKINLPANILVRNAEGIQREIETAGKWLVFNYGNLTCPSCDGEHELVDHFAEFAADNDSIEFVCLVQHNYPEDFLNNAWHRFRPSVNQIIFGSDRDFEFLEETLGCNPAPTPTWIVINPEGVVVPDLVSEPAMRYRPVQQFKRMMKRYHNGQL